MLLALRFFSVNDLFLVPLCYIIFYAVFRRIAEKNKDKQIKKIYYRAFYFKVICVLAYAFITEFYFKGGDTNLYYQGILDFRDALSDDFSHINDIAKSPNLEIENPLTPYFYYDNYSDDITYNYMRSSSNFSIPRLGLLPGIAFFNSYVCISMFFGFFALIGAIRIFRTFHYYYPNYTRELALATLFIPSVGFWSSGLLKDPICFGCIGFILYAVFNMFILKRNFITSIAWLLISGVLLYNIKVYILLALILAITVWLFAETNKLIVDKTLRRVFSVMTLAVSALITYLLLNYFTSQEVAQDYKLENLLEQTARQRRVIESVSTAGNSGFTIDASNPVSLAFNSIIATFFRPFIWEVNTPIALFSAFESILFLILTLNFFFKQGVSRYFKLIFTDPKLIMCFVFAVVFAVAVGASTTNFGALSRYKIPCMPFYFIMLLLLYKKASMAYPNWFNRVLSWFN